MNEFGKREIIESDEALWDANLVPAGCSQCGQAFLVPEKKRVLCPHCAKVNLEKQPVRLRKEEPELIIPFRSGKEKLEKGFKEFAREVRFSPADLNEHDLLSRLTPVYLPMWIVDGRVSGNWSAEAGYNYKVKSSREKYAGGSWQSEDVVETRVRWEPRAGELNRQYENQIVPAMEDHDRFIRKTGRFDLGRARPFLNEEAREIAYIVPDLDHENAWPQVKTGFDQSAGKECQKAAGADHMQNFMVNADYEDLHWTQLLLPVYTTYYTPDSGIREILMVNGQTGQVGGRRLASRKKGWVWAGILLGICLFFFSLGLLAMGLTAWIDLTPAVSGILIFLAVLFGIISLYPVIWPWQWNRRQEMDNSS